MFNYYDAWARIKLWRLNDAIELLSMYNALLDGHETIEDYLVSAETHYARVKLFVQRDVNSGTYPNWIKFERVDTHSVLDGDLNPIKSIDYFNTKVGKQELVEWAASKKIQVPKEFLKTTDSKGEKGADRGITEIIYAAVTAGIFCASQGVEVKKEQLQDELGMYGPNFEKIWKEIPEQFKLPGGKPKKVIEKIIDAAVVVAGYVAKERRRIPIEELKNKVHSEKGLSTVSLEHLEMIKASMETYILEH